MGRGRSYDAKRLGRLFFWEKKIFGKFGFFLFFLFFFKCVFNYITFPRDLSFSKCIKLFLTYLFENFHYTGFLRIVVSRLTTLGLARKALVETCLGHALRSEIRWQKHLSITVNKEGRIVALDRGKKNELHEANNERSITGRSCFFKFRAFLD